MASLREELAAVADGSRPISIKGVKGCLLLGKSEETVAVAESLARSIKNSGRGVVVRLLPDWRMLPPLP